MKRPALIIAFPTVQFFTVMLSLYSFNSFFLKYKSQWKIGAISTAFHLYLFVYERTQMTVSIVADDAD